MATKRFLQVVVSAVLCIALVFACSSIFVVVDDVAQAESLISTREQLVLGIANALDGDTLYVGDVDFGLEDLPLAVSIEKSITIKSGKSDGERARFTNGAFRILGYLKRSNVTFENIDFVGSNEDAQQFVEDNVSSLTSNGLVTPQIKRHIFSAITLSGNSETTVKNCTFEGYVAMSGGAILIDNTSADFVDKQTVANVNDSAFENNAAINGGAICVLASNQNATLSLLNSEIKSNFAYVGGGLYADKGKMKLANCKVVDNVASKHASISPSGVGGGTYLAQGSQLDALSSEFFANSATDGGGVYVRRSLSFFDGCVLRQNSAEKVGGGVYISPSESTPVTFLNSSLYFNSADNGGSVGIIGNIGNMGKTNFALCTFYKNVTSGEYNTFDLMDQLYVNMFGSVVIDDSLPDAYNETEEGDEYYTPWDEVVPPSENYQNNYIALPTQSDARGVVANDLTNGGHVKLNGISQLQKIDKQDLPQYVGDSFDNIYGDVLLGSNAQDLTINVDSQQIVFGYGQEVLLQTPTKKGHTFAGWIDENGNAVNLANLKLALGKSEMSITSTFAPNKYGVQIVNDGVEQIIEVYYGNQLDLPSVQKDGFDFAGWCTSPDGAGNKISSGDVYLHDGNLTLYAVWEEKFPLGVALGSVAGVIVAVSIIVALAVIVVKNKKKLAYEMSSSQEKMDAQVETCNLTEREKEVLALLLDGKKRSEIAKQLFVSEETIKKQISSIYRKLEVSSRSELFAKFR